jgi:hypothetical protein
LGIWGSQAKPISFLSLKLRIMNGILKFTEGKIKMFTREQYKRKRRVQKLFGAVFFVISIILALVAMASEGDFTFLFITVPASLILLCSKTIFIL